ncbi:MAG TPA: hypothetical protein VG518_07945 [Solirubrobacterales bacterium]|nr:hypothetical protein [Solirubrobacterales bacterium]
MDALNEKLVGAAVHEAKSRMDMARKSEGDSAEKNFDHADELLLLASLVFIRGSTNQERIMELLHPATQGMFSL